MCFIVWLMLQYIRSYGLADDSDGDGKKLRNIKRNCVCSVGFVFVHSNPHAQIIMISTFFPLLSVSMDRLIRTHVGRGRVCVGYHCVSPGFASPFIAYEL